MSSSSHTPTSGHRGGERVFRIAAVPGVTLTKWTRAWAERYPDIPLEVVRSTEPSQLWAVREGLAEVAFVRSQEADAEHSMITLYDELPVVVVPSGHPLGEVESVALADMAGENHLTGDASDAIELVAANIGIVIVPHSIARLNARKDVVAVPVSDAPVTSVAVAWTAGSADARIDDFIGIVRGRTARSSRSVTAAPLNTPPVSTGSKSDSKAWKAAAKTSATKSSATKCSTTKKAPRKQTAAESRDAANRRKRQGR